MGAATKIVLSIDPGRSKCGIAVVVQNSDQVHPIKVAHQEIINTNDLCKTAAEIAGRFSLDIIIVGNGTTSSQAIKSLKDLQIAPIEVVDEKFSTLLARKRFFEQNPPRGIRRLIPTSLQTPSRNYDDFVAVLLAERFLSS